MCEEKCHVKRDSLILKLPIMDYITHKDYEAQTTYRT